MAPKRAFLGQRVDAEALRLHQRELGRDVEGVGGEQEDGEEQAERAALITCRRPFASCAGTPRLPRLGGTSRATKAWPMPRVRMKVSLPRATFLSWRDVLHQRVGRHRRSPGMSAIRVGRPTSARWAATRVASSGGREAEPGRELEGEHHADRDRLAVEQAVGIAGGGLERVAEGVAEVEQRARRLRSRSSAATIAALARQATAMACSRSGQPATIGAPVGLQPGEEVGVADQPVLGDLGVAGVEDARRAACRGRRNRRAPAPAGGRRRRGSCRGRVLMPVLPPTEESTCGEQRRRHLDEAHAAAHDRRRRSRRDRRPRRRRGRRRCRSRSMRAARMRVDHRRRARRSSSTPRPAGR